jgi:poly(ADP-ribose) glycohydrolase ARH3
MQRFASCDFVTPVDEQPVLPANLKVLAVVDAELRRRFEGCLLGIAIGDALGAKFEAQSAEAIRARFNSVEALIAYPQDEIWYTDDTQMTIAVAEALVECGEIVESSLCRAFVANYVPSRGYGRGARAVLEAMEDGRDYGQTAERYFPGGSFGNGAAMRVAPIGLLFHESHEKLLAQAKASAWPTHRHALGIEGAQLIAMAIAHVLRNDAFDRARFFQGLTTACTTEEFRGKLELGAAIDSVNHLSELGNGIEAVNSVPTALTGFALSPESFESAVANAVFLGGDTDTIAAMTGAVSGAYLGIERLPKRLVALVESSPKGRDYLKSLAGRLFDAYQRASASDAAK